MCDICCDLLDLFEKYAASCATGDSRKPLAKAEINILCNYVQSWNQRQCTCCYKDAQSFDRFNAVVQGLLLTVISVLCKVLSEIKSAQKNAISEETAASSKDGEDSKAESDQQSSKAATEESDETWCHEDQEKLLQFASKLFLLSFPLYVAFKHSVHSKLEEVSQAEVTALNTVCDVNELDVPVYLLRNVSFFCTNGGLKLLTSCFQDSNSQSLRLSLAHSLIAVISNLKLWMNLTSVIQHLVPLRSCVIKYLCTVSEGELRGVGNRNMFEFILAAIKDPLDVHVSFDREGLQLAFKCFTSSTLTMRLSGTAQINSHINMYSELGNNESVSGAEVIGNALSNWLLEHKIIEHIFGPNLHVEIIKQSHFILNFLALEGQITSEHIDTIWSAAQLKHCSRQVLDLLPPLIKNLEVTPALHLYDLICALEPKEHNEQTLLLSSALIKYIWTSDNKNNVCGNVESNEHSCRSPFSVMVRGNLHLTELENAEKSDGSGSDESEEEKDDYPIQGNKAVNPQSDERPCSAGSSSDTQGSSSCVPQDQAWQDSLSGPDESDLSSDDSSDHNHDLCKAKESFLARKGVLKRVCLQDKKLAEAFSEDSLDEKHVANAAKRARLKPSGRKKGLTPMLEGEALKNGASPHFMPQIMKSALSADGTQPILKPEGLPEGMFECQQFLPGLHSQQHILCPSDMIEDILSPDDGSCNSSRMSSKSEKNMADFDGEESPCEDELVQLSATAQKHASCTFAHGKTRRKKTPKESNYFELETVCQSGKTLLWDLLQDDKITELTEELALEAEKILCSLICWSNDKMIRMKFIEGCLKNLAKSRSVVISLRLLPRLLGSFQQFRGSTDTHFVTMWAEKEHKMMSHFFNDLVNYTSGKTSKHKFYTHTEEIQVRLQFLSCVFSSHGSPDSFRLSREQIDFLWSSLATDSECADELFSWLLNQSRSKDQHALSVDLFKHILLEKLPQLPAATTSMMALNLLQQLSSLARTAGQNCKSLSVQESEMSGINQLWDIALKALSTDVSMAAIQYLNSFYFNGYCGTLEKEEEFMQRCMSSLELVSKSLSDGEENSLMIIQRALLLLKMHIEAFRRRYAFHLRRWQLQGESVVSHKASIEEHHISRMRIICQPAGLSEKITLELQSIDYVADLRAQVTHWWNQLEQEFTGPIRMISQGQELTVDLDEKTLGEIGFKDLQLVLVSVGAVRPVRKREGLEPASLMAPPPLERLPILLLLRQSYFEQLFSLMQRLGDMTTVNQAGESVIHTKAQILSRRVWEILMMIPTSPTILKGFSSMAKESSAESTTAILHSLLNPRVPQKLMYSLQIIESLRQQCNKYALKFVASGGLRHLFNIFSSGVLQPRKGEEWNEWAEDCLASLLRIIYLFGVEGVDLAVGSDDALELLEMPRKRIKRMKKGSSERLLIPKLNKVMLEMMGDVDSTLKCLMNILHEAALPCDPNQLKTGFWGRAHVVHCSMMLLVSWAHTEPLVKTYLLQMPNLSAWLKRLVLDNPDPCIRRETCTGLYRLCLGITSDGKSGHIYVVPLLTALLSFLSVAQAMKPLHLDEGEKETYGPGCKDYFFLVSQLVDSLSNSALEEQKCVIDLDNLARYLSEAIGIRGFRESRHHTVEDDGLHGLMTLLTYVMKHNPDFKFSKEGQEFLLKIFDCLFALPNPRERFLPKCKSQPVRSAAYDLLVEMVKGCEESYTLLHSKLLYQHSSKSHSPYPWDYWPHEDGRSECGYVGLTNLGATCYLASCMQHLYMMPRARVSVLSAKISPEGKHEYTLKELQRMFAYLLESERKAYNPRSFCKAYTMDHQPLNTGEQKDMAEFFTDLISKLEDMTPNLKHLVKTLFCGVISNNVVSLDCPHISRNLEEFYTLRCQVADMRNLYESLDELTVKDTLEGDNMYTCSQCGKKVRAEKRACIKKLPEILCFNTMRYTFNMVTMMKEKVNTHFSFPLRLDMSNYMEKNLFPNQSEGAKDDSVDSYDYELIGVTVHTGTADGGHYYSFIRERPTSGKDKWFLFNDAEVKPFDPSQIAAECFGGEMTSKTYDSVTDKFMDFSFEKTNSAYMLFYEHTSSQEPKSSQGTSSQGSSTKSVCEKEGNFQLSQELAEWIWEDNMQFLQDKSIFDHTYFNFLYQICGYIPQTFPANDEITLLSSELGISFVLETLIHSKEKPTIAQWIELLTKQFNASQRACEWFLDHMAKNEWWPVQILIKCPNQVVRQLFQRLCIHVINQLQPDHSSLYLQPYPDSDDSSDADISQIGQYSCVTRFVKKLLSLIEHGAKQHLKHLTEYFAFLHEFAKMGEEECHFLLSVEAISIIVNFYLGQKSEYVEVISDDEDEDDDDLASTADEKYKPASLEKMISLVVLLVEKSRGEDNRLQLSHSDYSALTGGKSFPFLHQQIRDSICLRQTCNLIFSLCRWNEHLAPHIVNMIFTSITKQPDLSNPFFKLLSMLVEVVGGPPGMPGFTTLVLQRIWEVAEYCPLQCLEWLTVQVARNKVAHSWVLQSMDSWVEKFLIAHNLQRVRNVAALLLVSLVPSSHFRQAFRSARNILLPQKEIPISSEALMVMHQIYEYLLRLLGKAKMYTDPAVHGTAKLMYYFAVMTYCLISKREKLMFSPYFLDLWNLFQPNLSEPAIPVHHNKQTLLLFWYQACTDCVENIKLIVQNPHVTKNIAFNYILADHDDQDVVVFNRCMLPAYYGLLRLCCQQSRTFTRQLANHQNIQWAFKNITPYTSLYMAAIGELFKLMELFVTRYPNSSEQELQEINYFKRTTLKMYLTALDARACWATLIGALRVLVETLEDKLFVIENNGITMLFQAFHTLHMMYHEATACHVTGDMVDLLSMTLLLLKCAHNAKSTSEVQTWMSEWKEHTDVVRKLLTLLNTYTPPEIRQVCIDVLIQLVLLYPQETVMSVVPLLAGCHASFQENNGIMTTGPYFPRRGQKAFPTKSNVRPQRPMLQMFLHPSQLEASKGVDPEYDQALVNFFLPYHKLVETVCRTAISHSIITQDLVNLSAIVSIEGIPLHLDLIPKLWLEVMQNETCPEFGEFLCSSGCLTECIQAVLLEERGYLNNPLVFQLFSLLIPKVGKQVVKENVISVISSRILSLVSSQNLKDLNKHALRINADLRAISIVFSIQKPSTLSAGFSEYLSSLSKQCKDIIKKCPTSSDKTENCSKQEDIEVPAPAKKLKEMPQPSTSKVYNKDDTSVGDAAGKVVAQDTKKQECNTIRTLLDSVNKLQKLLNEVTT